MTLARYSDSLATSVRKLTKAPVRGESKPQPSRGKTPTTPIQTTAIDKPLPGSTVVGVISVLHSLWGRRIDVQKHRFLGTTS